MEVSRETLIERYFPDSARIRAYAELLAGPGIERGLIGPREADRIWERHIFNCLPITQLLKEGSILFDVGSGAGLPGIVIALARPDLHVTLIEPLERRVEFLKEAVLGLDIEVIRGQAQDVRVTAHYVSARAVAPLEKLKKISWHLLKTGGSLMAIKGRSAEEEMRSVPRAILHEVNFEGIELGRIVELRKGA
ncbi:MAG: 16S rRNA (guanine(527)-N(7))-methyltransferase RsmG [Actinomycetales bacterium]|nr:MAG: 16S rRNA (guanine(527)-N(7))-methyltransferase RsmG [Actinomycetales bacterium]